MSFLFNKCTFSVLDENTINECDSFLCGNDDLDDFFHSSISKASFSIPDAFHKSQNYKP